MSWQVRIREGVWIGTKGERSTMLNWSHLSRLWIGRMDGAGNGWIWALFWTIRPFISELCRRPAYLNKHDQERCDCRPRRQHLGLQLRIQRESFLPSFLVSKSATGKILGTEQSIARNGFNFWRAYEPSLGSCYGLCYGRNVKPNKGTSWIHRK